MPGRDGVENKSWGYAALATLLALFAVDLVTPAGIAEPALYVLAILLAALSRNRVLLSWVLLAGVVLATLGYWLQPAAIEVVPDRYVIANRFIAVLAITVTGILGFVLLSALRQLSEANSLIARQQQLADMAGELAHFGAWALDLATRKLTWSKEVFRIYELDAGSEPPLQEAIEFFAPEFRSHVGDTVQRCIDDGIGWHGEWQLITAQGRRIWVRSIGTAVRDDSGRIVRLQGSFQDIDARRRAEESAERNRERFRQLADAMPMLVWTTTADGLMDFLNRSGFEFTGVTDPDDVMAEAWVSRLHPDDRQRTKDSWLHSVTTGRDYQTEFRLQRHDGHYRWHQASARPIRNDEGGIVQWFGACIDIHEQRDLSDRLAETLERIGDAFFALDREWRFVYINSAGETLTGESRDELLGEVVWNAFPPAFQSKFHQQYQLALDSGESVHFTAEYPPMDLWLEVSAHPTDDGLAIYMRNITAQRKAEERHRQLQRLESVGQLTGGIAHDFNNLLTVIIGNTELLADLVEKDEDTRQICDAISDAARRGAELTQRLLAFARRQPLDPRPTDTDHVVAGVVALLRRTLGEHIDVIVRSDHASWPAQVDPGGLENAMLNLCINARDAMPGGGHLYITTSARSLDDTEAADIADAAAGDFVTVTVADTGCGIEPEVLARVFDPFFTTKDVGKGTGLGLPMVYGFAHQSGGFVTIESTPGEGTSVTLYLPRATEAVTLPPATHPSPSPARERFCWWKTTTWCVPTRSASSMPWATRHWRRRTAPPPWRYSDDATTLICCLLTS
jgi:PAS domain S-box-containing protein